MTSYCSSIHSLCSFSSDEPFNLLSSLHINGFICLWATPVVKNLQVGRGTLLSSILESTNTAQPPHFYPQLL
ncbi:hypothetical protein Hanom_Chr15g01374151 [Helianthus anomalus]